MKVLRLLPPPRRHRRHDLRRKLRRPVAPLFGSASIHSTTTISSHPVATDPPPPVAATAVVLTPPQHQSLPSEPRRPGRRSRQPPAPPPPLLPTQHPLHSRQCPAAKRRISYPPVLVWNNCTKKECGNCVVVLRQTRWKRNGVNVGGKTYNWNKREIHSGCHPRKGRDPTPPPVPRLCEPLTSSCDQWCRHRRRSKQW